MPEALKGIDWRGHILIDGTNAHMDPDADIRKTGSSPCHVVRTICTHHRLQGAATRRCASAGCRFKPSRFRFPAQPCPELSRRSAWTSWLRA